MLTLEKYRKHIMCSHPKDITGVVPRTPSNK